jgi:hypothetical protein
MACHVPHDMQVIWMATGLLPHSRMVGSVVFPYLVSLNTSPLTSPRINDRATKDPILIIVSLSLCA